MRLTAGRREIGSSGRRRIVAVGVAALFVAAAACGGDDVDDVAADPERFCEIETELDELDPLNPNLTPDEIRLVIPDARTLVDEERDVAPNEIRSSVKTLVDVAVVVFDAIEAADFDRSEVGPDEFPADFFDEAGAFATASETVEVWIEGNCESTP
jgi:hypothetical protein